MGDSGPQSRMSWSKAVTQSCSRLKAWHGGEEPLSGRFTHMDVDTRHQFFASCWQKSSQFLMLWASPQGYLSTLTTWPLPGWVNRERKCKAEATVSFFYDSALEETHYPFCYFTQSNPDVMWEWAGWTRVEDQETGVMRPSWGLVAQEANTVKPCISDSLIGNKLKWKNKIK